MTSRPCNLSFRDLSESTEVVFTQGPFKTEARLCASPERLDGRLRQARRAADLARWGLSES